MMRELFDSFKKVKLSEVNNLVLIDTCFFISLFEHPEHLKNFTLLNNKAITSFNVCELINVDHKLGKIKHAIREFLNKCSNLIIIELGVVPGDRQAEKKFVNSVDTDLLKHCADPSDAVLLAAAVKTKSVILTKDKHHLFTVELENFLKKYDVKVYKAVKELV